MTNQCYICKTSTTRKWYRHPTVVEAFLCQSHYRQSRYLARRNEILEHQRERYATVASVREKAISRVQLARGAKSNPKCHQRLIREKFLAEDLQVVGSVLPTLHVSEYQLLCEPFAPKHRKFIERYEWLGNIGNSPKWTFAAYCCGHLAGVVLIAEPQAYAKVLRGYDRSLECLITRGACVSWAHQHLGSKLIAFALRWMVQNTDKRVFSAYSDPRAGEIGTIYQACGFDYLGPGFGARYAYKSKEWKPGKWFTAQSLRRTTSLKRWLKSEGILWEKEWERPNGYKDLSKLPRELKVGWDNWVNSIIATATKKSLPNKGKYLKVLGRNRSEHRKLQASKLYQCHPYPKRIAAGIGKNAC